MTIFPQILSILSGGAVGFCLGLIGGGGSILAVPLLVYVVGVPDPHMAIGTSALAVAGSGATNLVYHARTNNVKWLCAIVFMFAGIAGVLVGATIGRHIDGQKLLTLFGLLMIAIGAAMLLPKASGGRGDVTLDRENLPKLLTLGLVAGTLSGFFGIGGGFLIVPSLMLATGMPMLNAVGSSLVAVTAFGLMTAANYALVGLVDWTLAGLFVAGGFAGSFLGTWSARALAGHRGVLNLVFSALIFVVAGYILTHTAHPT